MVHYRDGKGTPTRETPSGVESNSRPRAPRVSVRFNSNSTKLACKRNDYLFNAHHLGSEHNSRLRSTETASSWKPLKDTSRMKEGFSLTVEEHLPTA